jgi:hypothetical protein
LLWTTTPCPALVEPISTRRKSSEAGAEVTSGATAAVPEPLSASWVGLRKPLCTISRLAVNGSVVVGAKITLTVQDASLASTPVQVVGTAGSTLNGAVGGLTEIAPRVSGPLVTLVKVTWRDGEGTLVGWLPKSAASGVDCSGPAILPDTVNRLVCSGAARPGPVTRNRFAEPAPVAPTIGCSTVASADR